MAVVFVTMILFVYSEELFWAVPRHADNLFNFMFVYSIYLTPTFFVLYLSDKFNVKTVWNLFLVGSIYGWIIEGIIVDTMYEDMPFSISFTGMAWHSLISVLFGFYLFQKAINAADRKGIIKLSILTGTFWGVWAVNWYKELGYLPSVTEFFIFSTAFTTLLVIGFAGYNHLKIREFKPSKLEKAIFFAVFGFFYLVDVLFSAFSIYVLLVWTPLVLANLYFLKLSRTQKADNNLNDSNTKTSNQTTETVDKDLSSIIFVSETANSRLALYIFLIAPIASIVYGVEVTMGFIFSTVELVYIVTLFISLVFYIKAVIKAKFERYIDTNRALAK